MTGSVRRLYVKNFDAWEKISSKSAYSEKELSVRVIRGGVALPTLVLLASESGEAENRYVGGVLDSAMNFVAGMRRGSEESPGGMSVMGAYSVDPAEVEYLDEDVIFGGIILGHFGHFLMEGMARFWYFLQNPGDKRRIAIMTAIWNRRPWFDDFFKLLGIDSARILYVERPTRFASVTVPEESVHSWGGFFTKEYLVPYRVMRGNAPPGTRRKIYLSRRRYADGLVSCRNEEYFEEFFAAKGFEIFYPERHSLADQVGAAAGAEEIACTLGTLSHFALFARRGVKLTLLARTDDSALAPQCLINEAVDADWRIIDVSMNFLYGQRDFGVLLLGATRWWKEFARDCYGEELSDDTLSDGKVLRDYMTRWARWAANPDVLKILDNLDFVTLFNRFFENITEGEALPERRLTGSPKYALMEKELLDAKWGSVSDANYIKALEAGSHTPLAAYETHIAGRGWLPAVYDGQTGGLVDGGAAVDALKVSLRPARAGIAVMCSVYHPARGWLPETQGVAGTGRAGEPLYGVRLRLAGDGAEEFEIFYKIFNPANGWSPQVRGGQEVGSDDAPIAAVKAWARRK